MDPLGARFPWISPLDAPLLTRVVNAGERFRGPLPPGHEMLCSALGHAVPVEVLLVPFRSHADEPCVAWADDAGHRIDAGAAQDLIEAVPLLVAALQGFARKDKHP